MVWSFWIWIYGFIKNVSCTTSININNKSYYEYE